MLINPLCETVGVVGDWLDFQTLDYIFIPKCHENKDVGDQEDGYAATAMIKTIYQTINDLLVRYYSVWPLIKNNIHMTTFLPLCTEQGAMKTCAKLLSSTYHMRCQHHLAPGRGESARWGVTIWATRSPFLVVRNPLSVCINIHVPIARWNLVMHISAWSSLLYVTICHLFDSKSLHKPTPTDCWLYHWTHALPKVELLC